MGTWFASLVNNFIGQFDTPFHIIVQVISLVGTLLNVLSLQFKKPVWFYSLMFFGSTCFMIHFALLGAYGGCVLNFIVLIRSITLLLNKKSKTLFVMILFCVLFVIATIIIIIFGLEAKNRWYALLPLFASIIQTVGVWNKSPKKTRWFQVAGSSPGWIIYNVINGSIGGVACELFMITSGIIYLIRHRKDEESDVFEKTE